MDVPVYLYMPMTKKSGPLSRRNYELSILKTIAEALNRSADLEEILQVALAQLAELLDLHTGWIWLLREESGESYLAAAQNLPPALTKKPERMAGSCFCLDSYREGDMDGAANVNVITCSRLKFLSKDTAGLRYHTSIPLYAHGKQLGILNVAGTDWRELSPEDLRLLYTVGDMLGMAVERARLFNQSVQLGAIEERNRLAREIHDTLAQGLTAVQMKLETADALLEKGDDPEGLHASLHSAIALTRATLEESRRSVLDLRAAPLEGRSISEALPALVDTFRQNRKNRVVLSISGENRPLPSRIEVGLYRVAQEALTNIQKHAEADTIHVHLLMALDQVRLSIKDDGKGFEPDQISHNSFGLIGLNERIRLLGGTLIVQSSTGEGTFLEVSIPLK
jgi:two-component system NarL family sensor kinase